MNDNKNQNKNYVIPEKVDLEKVKVENNNNGALNRERDNIISASIQANQAIDEKSAKDVNNTIKVHKKHPLVNILIGLFFIALAGVLTFFGLKLVKGYIKYDDARHTTEKTTTEKINYFQKYVYDNERMRKFQNDNTILILLPTLASNEYKYIYANKDVDGILKTEEGTYNIQNKQISLFNSESIENTFFIGDSNISYGELSLAMYDQEFKYYISKNDGIDSLLVLNAKVDSSFAYFSDSNNHMFANFTETQNDISLSNGYIFNKVGTNLEFNGLTYIYVE